MDETRKAASVGQLKELHDAVMPRIEALEAEGGANEADPMQEALVQTLAARLLMLEQKCDQMVAKLDEPDVPVDLSPLLSAISVMGEQITLLTKLVEGLLRPVTRTGEAVMPDGKRVTLQVSETRM